MMALIFQKEFLDVDAIYGKKLLHFAPEVGFGNWLRRQFPQLNYQSADLFSPDVDLCLDLQEIALPNNCVDFIVLSHVLEHVVNDIKALSELNRILCLGGKLFVQVPLSEKPETIEDRLDSADSRLLHYGKTDHVRLYGADLKNRLSDAGFEVIIESASNEAYRELMPRMALDLPDNSTMLYDNESTTFICQKISF
jgi:predicted SAM-dependent methyltransferase